MLFRDTCIFGQISLLWLQCKTSYAWPRIVFGSINFKKKSWSLVLPKGKRMQNIGGQNLKNKFLVQPFVHHSAITQENDCWLSHSDHLYRWYPTPDQQWGKIGQASLLHSWLTLGLVFVTSPISPAFPNFWTWSSPGWIPLGKCKWLWRPKTKPYLWQKAQSRQWTPPGKYSMNRLIWSVDED